MVRLDPGSGAFILCETALSSAVFSGLVVAELPLGFRVSSAPSVVMAATTLLLVLGESWAHLLSSFNRPMHGVYVRLTIFML